VNVNLSLIRDIAATQRFQAETGEKVLRLKQILVEFQRHPALKQKLVLKGGTALNLFYLDLARLSVDIGCDIGTSNSGINFGLPWVGRLGPDSLCNSQFLLRSGGLALRGWSYL
jgi:hypothetical protein